MVGQAESEVRSEVVGDVRMLVEVGLWSGTECPLTSTTPCQTQLRTRAQDRILITTVSGPSRLRVPAESGSTRLGSGCSSKNHGDTRLKRDQETSSVSWATGLIFFSL